MEKKPYHLMTDKERMEARFAINRQIDANIAAKKAVRVPKARSSRPTFDLPTNEQLEQMGITSQPMKEFIGVTFRRMGRG